MTSVSVDSLYTPPKISFFQAFSHWWQAGDSMLSVVEQDLLSTYISFYPDNTSEDKTDKRSARVLDVPLSGSGRYIHELFIENDASVPASDPATKHIVFVHGFGASLGFFFRNFEQFSQIKGVKLHFIDMLGFGLSARPKFPKYRKGSSKAEDLKVVEEFFVDSLEEWRKVREIEDFVLIGHSLGGYMSFAYSLKYPQYLLKLLLISPVGVERSLASVEYSMANSKSEEQIKNNIKGVSEQELPQGSDMRGEVSDLSNDGNQDAASDETDNKLFPDLKAGEEPKKSEVLQPQNNSSGAKIIKFVWESHLLTPLSLIRFGGPAGLQLTYRWSKRRFTGSVESDDEFLLLHKYVYYSIVGRKPSGEAVITRILAPGTAAYFPLLDRVPTDKPEITANSYFKKTYGDKTKSIVDGIETYWMYGDRDWMDKDAGKVISEKINDFCKSKLSKFKVIKDAGHHVYLDNPGEFYKEVVAFITPRLQSETE